jgi:hypothetical protein
MRRRNWEGDMRARTAGAAVAGHYNARSDVDNAAIARALAEIADLLEIRGDNPFRIRAYRTAADTVAAEPTPVSALDEAALRGVPRVAHQ